MGSRRWAAVVALGILGDWQTARAQRPSFVIEGRNIAGVPKTVLDDAAARVQTMYDQAGVDASWTDDLVEARRGSLILTVIIAHGTTRKQVDEEAFGLAPEGAAGCGRIAYAFWDRIADYARRFRLDASVVLAAVMAHETGHLVLPQYSHSPGHGVMSAHWRTNDFIEAKRGNMRFTRTESARMQDQILHRCPRR